MKRSYKISLYVFFVVTGLALGLTALTQHLFEKPGSLNQTKILIIEKGTSINKIAEQLAQNGVIDHPFIFKAAVVLSGNRAHLMPGEYKFVPHSSMLNVLRDLVLGRSVVHYFTVYEGQTTLSVIANLKKLDNLSGEVPSNLKEGDLLPETYQYSYGDKRTTLITRMKNAMKKTLFELWEARDPDLLLKTPEEAVILASIIEKETSLLQEKHKIAGVFYNRMRKKMPLQADPTVAYGLADDAMCKILDRKLTKKDLKKSTPYNTYIHKGLPPTPIANPGKQTLKATLHPEKTKALYFVVNGDGGHSFAEKYVDHQCNIDSWKKKTAALKPALPKKP